MRKASPLANGPSVFIAWTPGGCAGLLARLAAGHRRVARLVIQSGPGHAVLGQVDLQPEPGQDGEPEDAVDRCAGQPQGVHAHELEGVLDPGLDVREPRAALDVEPSMGVQKSAGSAFRPIFLAVSVATNSAGAPESTRKLNGPLPLIRTRTRKWLVSVSR